MSLYFKRYIAIIDTWLPKQLRITNTASIGVADFLSRFRDPIRVPRIRKNYHRVPKIRENRVPRIREIRSLQIQTRFLTFSLKKPWCSSRQILGGVKEFCLKTKKVFDSSHQTHFLEKKVKFRRISFSLIWRCQNICAWIFRDFAQIFNKSNLLGVRLHPLHPQLLHHWLLLLQVFPTWIYLLSNDLPFICL